MPAPLTAADLAALSGALRTFAAQLARIPPAQLRALVDAVAELELSDQVRRGLAAQRSPYPTRRGRR